MKYVLLKRFEDTYGVCDNINDVISSNCFYLDNLDQLSLFGIRDNYSYKAGDYFGIFLIPLNLFLENLVSYPFFYLDIDNSDESKSSTFFSNQIYDETFKFAKNCKIGKLEIFNITLEQVRLKYFQHTSNGKVWERNIYGISKYTSFCMPSFRESFKKQKITIIDTGFSDIEINLPILNLNEDEICYLRLIS